MLTCLADGLIVHYRWPAVVGLVLLGTENVFGVGGFTGSALLALGVFGGCFRDWRTEPGLWMLSTLFLPIFGIPCSVLVISAVRDWMRPVAVLSVDPVLGMSVLGVLTVVMATVTRVNWGLKAKPKSAMLDEF